MRVRHFNVNPMACRYQYNNDLSTYTPNGYVFTNTPPQTGMGYDISADYVDSTTAYDPRPASSTQLDQIADSALIPASNNTGEFSLSTEPAHLCVRVSERAPTSACGTFSCFLLVFGAPASSHGEMIRMGEIRTRDILLRELRALLVKRGFFMIWIVASVLLSSESDTYLPEKWRCWENSLHFLLSLCNCCR